MSNKRVSNFEILMYILFFPILIPLSLFIFFRNANRRRKEQAIIDYQYKKIKEDEDAK